MYLRTTVTTTTTRTGTMDTFRFSLAFLLSGNVDEWPTLKLTLHIVG